MQEAGNMRGAPSADRRAQDKTHLLYRILKRRFSDD